jgi:CelD/BcsL family acetyltransferase involved in cellulose biosynthesis
MQIEWIPLDWARDHAPLADAWQTLEAAADGSIFQSWSWIGCRITDRFTDPWLLRASVDGRVVGLALFNQTGGRGLGLDRALRLHETGDAGEDSVFVEYSGPLLARGYAELLRPMLAVAVRQGRLVLSGVGGALRDEAMAVGACRVTRTRPAPFVALEGRSEADWLAALGSSTRYHLRRSWRAYEAGGGRIVARQAADVAEGWAFLDALAALHQASWTARGYPGAFAEPAFRVFHRALVERGLPRGEVELTLVSVDQGDRSRVIGYLYNLRWRDRVYSYQSGFDYAGAGPHQSPGLTCHHAAIGAAIASGARCYDFLAGEARYKTSLSTDAVELHWLELARPLTWHGVMYWLRGVR